MLAIILLEILSERVRQGQNDYVPTLLVKCGSLLVGSNVRIYNAAVEALWLYFSNRKSDSCEFETFITFVETKFPIPHTNLGCHLHSPDSLFNTNIR